MSLGEITFKKGDFERTVPLELQNDGIYKVKAPFSELPAWINALKPQDPVEMSFVEKKQRITFNAIVSGYEKIPSPPAVYLLFQKTSELAAQNDRNFFRVEIVMDCTLTVFRAGRYTEFPGVTIDISGGGTKLRTDSLLNGGEQLKFYAKYMPKPGAIDVNAEVVRVTKNRDEKKKYAYDVGLRFIHDSQGAADKAAKYCQELMFAQRRKQLGD